ncbi:MAG TPA: hypothetical protein VGQ18_10590 [Gemmatimonadales bacterium]|jgi:hypothetical protein|nr:hypothetical protein [Gemmatimonadales bacterium]
MHSVLTDWESFYVIVGSSAGALTGLMFVVITLVADAKIKRSIKEINAFASPAVVHLTAVLLISAVLSAPWPNLQQASVGVGLGALAGLVYMVIVLRRLLQPTTYAKVMEDWVWHGALPFVAYVALLFAHMGLRHEEGWGLYAVGGATLLLLSVGIHNAWDTVVYMVVSQGKDH